MATRAALMPSHDMPSRDPSIRLQRTASQLSRRNSSVKDDSLAADLNSVPSNPRAPSPISQSFDMASRNALQDDYTELSGPTASQYNSGNLQRSPSATSLGRSNTLRKQKSLSRKSSLRRSSSKRSVRAGSIGGITYDDTSGVDTKSVYYTPIPTTGSPTDILANRFQNWRKFLKDLINYFREVQSTYESRAKQLARVSNIIGAVSLPTGFLGEGGLGDALQILRQHHQETIAETTKAREIENDVISQLSVLRTDLGQKIKEIKSLSGDFKNSIEKEKESTKKIVGVLQESLAAVDSDAKAMVGKDDPYIVRLAVERQVERQIDEENFLHRAYLNLEGSGRELESIVVGEVQKALNAFATILKKEGDDSYETIERLRNGPINMAKDLEWSEFIMKDSGFVPPDVPLRRAQDMEYPGKHHPSATEVRAGMLERKSKYLKSYTPGWFVLSPTHMHEFRSADSVYTQAPVMSLYLPDQKLGAHSQPDSSSNKFILKGRQTGGMHRGHSWVFRAETYDTMLAWYDDIKNLTEKSGEERNRFIRGHSRSFSSRSATSTSSFEDDEADRIPYSAEAAATLKRNASIGSQGGVYAEQQRPQPGGRFPSDLQNGRDLPTRLAGSSDGSELDHDITTEAGGLQGEATLGDKVVPSSMRESTTITPMDQKSLIDLEGALYVAQNGYPTREAPATRTETKTSQQTFQSPAYYPHRSSVNRGAATTSSIATSQSYDDRDTPIETPYSTFTSEPDQFRVHQSPERPIKTSTQEAIPYSYHTASIESYSSPPQEIESQQPPPESNIVFSNSGPTRHEMPSNPVPSTTKEVMKEADPKSPRLSRKGTDVSVSNLYVPGGYPSNPRASIA